MNTTMILASILRDLPANRDWLDPAVEREAVEAVKENTLEKQVEALIQEHSFAQVLEAVADVASKRSDGAKAATERFKSEKAHLTTLADSLSEIYFRLMKIINFSIERDL